MTEYDYSPEAYQRYLATQTRIANWVDKTEQHRAQFQHAVPTGPIVDAPPAPPSHSRQRRPHHLPGHSQLPRQLFVHVPSPESDSSDDYADGPGPMPLSAPAMMYPSQPMFQPMAAPMGQPMLTPSPMMMPPNFVTPPHRPPHHHHRSHSRARSRHHSPGYYTMASPPVSSGYQYGYPSAPMGGAHPGYIMMPPQPHRGQQIPMMPDISQHPRPATTGPIAFGAAPGTRSASGSYFQQHPGSTFVPPAQASYPGPMQAATSPWSTHGASLTASHSVLSTPSGTQSVGAASLPRRPSYVLPHYQSMSSAMATASYLNVPPPPAPPHRPTMPSAQSYVPPQYLHQNVYDTSAGSMGRHYLRHSVG